MRQNTQKLFMAFALVTLNIIISTAHAQGTAFTYQGRLNSGGNPATGSYDIAFTLYTTNVTGSAIAGPVTNTAVAVTNGLFTTTVDFGNAYTGTSNWLEIAVSTNAANAFTTLAPRQQLTPVPYAITAANVSGTISAAQLPAAVVTNGASGVSFSGSFAASNNIVAGGSITANGGRLNDQPLYLRGGNDLNHGLAYNGSAVTNFGTGQYPVDGPALWGYGGGLLGVRNGGDTAVLQWTASGVTVNGTLSGNGSGLTGLNASQLSSGVISQSVLPGFQGPNYESVGGGQVNTASGYYSTVPGGLANMAAGVASFAAGIGAQAINNGSFVWADDSASGALFSSTAANQFLIRAAGGVGIGKNNPATALDVDGTVTATAFVGNGSGLTGLPSTVVTNNETGVALNGFRLNGNTMYFLSGTDTNHGVGYFGTGNLFAGQNVNGPVLFGYGGGGLGINQFGVEKIPLAWDAVQNVTVSDSTSSGNPVLTVSGNGNAGNGTLSVIDSSGVSGSRIARFGTGGGNWVAVLDTAGNWTATAFNTTSDKNVKENFTPVDAQSVLAKVAALPISRWNFTNSPAVPHVGPMAQDFYHAFNVGADDRHIATVDEDGVALAAIQGLNEKLEKENAELKRRLDALEKLMLNQKPN